MPKNQLNASYVFDFTFKVFDQGRFADYVVI